MHDRMLSLTVFSLSLSLSVCVCVCARARARVCVVCVWVIGAVYGINGTNWPTFFDGQGRILYEYQVRKSVFLKVGCLLRAMHAAPQLARPGQLPLLRQCLRRTCL